MIYNIFDQNPEDNLFPLCRKLDIGIIARVPFDEGTLTGTLTKDTVFPAGDWRATYFVPENLIPSVEHADALKPLIPENMTMPEMALRFILCNDDVHTIIPGMRTVNSYRIQHSHQRWQKAGRILTAKIKRPSVGQDAHEMVTIRPKSGYRVL